MAEQKQVWVRICAVDKVVADKATGFTINGQRLVLTRCGNDVQVLQGFCSHMVFPLANSKVSDCVLTCGLHRSKFDINDGSVVEWSTFPPVVGAALAAIRKRQALRTYATRISEGDVYIEWTAENADAVRVTI